MSVHSSRCPGRDHFLDAHDLDPKAFRRLVGRRARCLLDPGIGPIKDEKGRRAAESAIEQHAEKIHRGNDFLPIRFLADGAERALAVCRIRTPTPEGTFFGTGFLIGNRLLMTNNHVLETPAAATASTAEFGLEAEQAPTLVALRPERLFLTDAGLDYTIVASYTAPIADHPTSPLVLDPATVTRGERVNIVQHPQGRPKEVALHDNRVERILDTVIRYRTDTEPGSSGSPVFSDTWELVALHHAGETEPGGSAINEGIRISAIVAHLLAVDAGGTDESLRRLLGDVTDQARVGFFDLAAATGRDHREVQVDDFTGLPDVADVGVWNIEHFNDTVSDTRVRDVGDVVARLGLDVLGLVEVERGALERLVDDLAGRGTSAGFALLDVGGRQDLAVLFDRETTEVRLRDDLADRHRARLEARTASGRTAFPRAPLFADCAVAGPDGDVVRFLFLVVHLKAFGGAENEERRRLAARMLSEIADDLRDREALPVVIGGDFNERLTTDVLTPLTDSPDIVSLTMDDAGGDAISFVGTRHRSLIDHIVVSGDAVLGEIRGDDAAIVRLDRTVSDFADRVSDHVPVVFRLAFRGDAQDGRVDHDADTDTQGDDIARVVTIPLPAGAEELRLEIQGGRIEVLPARSA